MYIMIGVGVLLMVDIVLTFFRATYLSNGTLVYDLPSLRTRYIATRLLSDLIAFFPLDLLLMLYGVADHKHAQWIRLPRMYAVYATWHLRGYTFSLGSNTSMATSILRLLVITAVITHIFACIWYYIGTIHMVQTYDNHFLGIEPKPTEDRSHWVYYYEGMRYHLLVEHGVPVARQYLLAYYWCASTLTTAGRIGQVTPKNTSELVFTIVSMTLTLTFYGYVMGEITNLVMSNDDALVQKRQKVGLVQVCSADTPCQ
jgi:hypothetical protein